jgi:nitroreductase
MEKVILEATRLGLGTCWLGGTFTKSSFARKANLQSGEIIPCVVSAGYPAEQPHFIERLARERASSDRRRPWERLFFDTDFETPLTPDRAGDFATALEMVRQAPSASNKQPWLILRQGEAWHFFLRRTPGYREGMMVRLVTVADLQRIDLGIAMCHFELTARDFGLPGGWTIQQPPLVPQFQETKYIASWMAT